MVNQQQNKGMYCSEQLSLACLAINAPLQRVKALFRNKEMSIIDYSDGTQQEVIVEVRFDTATLTCLFDTDGLCEGVFLFLDDLMDITRYIEHCSKAYPYHYILQSWVNNDCCIQITTENKECSLLILPIKQAKEVIN